jgi:uncharacterized membrane protein YjfL (UPF0719 family)
MDHLIHMVVQCIIFSAIGLVMFGIAFLVFEKVVGVSIRKEIGEEHNTALGIVMAGVMIALAIIVAAATGS